TFTKKKKISSSVQRALFTDSVESSEPGVAYLHWNSPTYLNRYDQFPKTIRKIIRVGNHYVIKSYDDLPPRTAAAGQYTTTFGIETINRLPSLQREYAQGRPVNGLPQWIGPDQNEIFSWGPSVRTLEYDGSNYAYDRNGALVAAGLGNGVPANTHQPLRFFRTGINTANELLLTLPAIKGSTLIISLEQKTKRGIIPNSDFKNYNFSLRTKDIKIRKNLSMDGRLSYHLSEGKLLNRGANLATIMSSILTTPVTFDNTNGQSSAAIFNREKYILPDGTFRSQSPALVNNPYFLINQLPDHEQQDHYLAGIHLNHHWRNWSTQLTSGLDKQNNNIIHGFPIGYATYTGGRMTNRKTEQSNLYASISPSYSRYQYNSELKANISYQVNYIDNQLQRQDGFHFTNEDYSLSHADSMVYLNRNLSRVVHEVSANVQYRYEQYLLLKAGQRQYFSTTLNANRYVNFFPSLGVSIDLAHFMDWPVNRLEPFYSVSRTIREAPLIYSNESYASTALSSSSYTQYYENTELFFQPGLAPETEVKQEAGLHAHFFDNFTLEASYYYNLTRNFIAPMAKGSGYALSNAAKVKNEGVTFTVSFVNDSYYQSLRWGTDLNWSTYNNTVKEIYSASPWIALAGFNDVATVLAPGKPVGAIYGTTFQRNGAGQLIIGSDGYPMVAGGGMKMIGNPIPQWMLGWNAYLEWKRWRLSYLFDFKAGAQTWNGTNAVLDYLGKSASTGVQRNTGNYLFDGVDVQGNINTHAVNFADPALPLENNRWVRYGTTGVGEAYIQKTSWVRLSEVTLSYTTRSAAHKVLIKEAKFSLTGKNLFLITPYKGVDPSSSLFGNATGNGLDLFNTPG
ncbi:MAG: hypothetical protein C0523_11585, partial [Cytophaga sp.]|nr:hypothetical protein [Cytophaga sp.]